VIKDSAATLSNFMLLYVFTNYAFIYEVLCKITDVDGTADLKV
jgi:hypothetical protein